MRKTVAELHTVTNKGKFHSRTTGAESEGAGDREKNDELGLQTALLPHNAWPRLCHISLKIFCSRWVNPNSFPGAITRIDCLTIIWLS